MPALWPWIVMRRMIMSAYESIMKGLNEAFDFAKGKETEARMHRVDMVSTDRRRKFGFARRRRGAER